MEFVPKNLRAHGSIGFCGIDLCCSSAPAGARDCSHGGSAAEPVDSDPQRKFCPDGAENFGSIACGCSAGSRAAAPLKFLRPAGAKPSERPHSHGFRFAPPVATLQRAAGARITSSSQPCVLFLSLSKDAGLAAQAFSARGFCWLVRWQKVFASGGRSRIACGVRDDIHRRSEKRPYIFSIFAMRTYSRQVSTSFTSASRALAVVPAKSSQPMLATNFLFSSVATISL